MQIFVGPQHPHLEQKLLAEVQRFKAGKALKPLLILVPSDDIRRRLMILLTREAGLSLVALSIMTFHQLSEKLNRDNQNTQRGALRSELFFEEMLRAVLSKEKRMAQVFSALLDTEGGPASLWSTFRDLKEGRVEADIVLQALQEGHFGQGRLSASLKPLFQLYRHCLTLMQGRSLLDYGDLTAKAIDRVAEADELKSFEGVFYYGFYDLTQVQIDLLHEIARVQTVSLFFPRVADAESNVGAERFFERYLEGLAPDGNHITLLSEPPENRTVCTITDCYDTQAEVLCAAKEILKLQDQGVDFDQMAVISRELSPYLGDIQRLFKQYEIPLTSHCEISIMSEAMPTLVHQMTSLLLEDFPRAAVVILLLHPRFDLSVLGDDADQVERSAWRDLSLKAGINKGFDSWQQLEALATKKEEKDPGMAMQCQLLWRGFLSLYEVLHALPERATWSDYVQRWQLIFKNTLGISGSEIQEKGAQAPSASEAAIASVLSQLVTLDIVSSAPTRAQFIETFQRWLARASHAFAPQNTAGVVVIDLMSARALPFSHLFLLGLNEGHFPRHIREDPFLPDHHRRVLEVDLGYKVGEKLAGYDEEKLLFSLLVDSARTHLHVLTHRVDALGGPAAGSVYLEVLRKRYLNAPEKLQVKHIARSLLHRTGISPFAEQRYASPQEWAILSLLRSEKIDAIIPLLNVSSRQYAQSHIAQQFLEHERVLGNCDGLIGEAGHWDNMLKDGLSPSALENYVHCPFQFFARRLLGLKPEKTNDGALERAPNEIGKLCHDILKRVYEGLTDGLSLKNMTDSALKTHVSECCELVFLEDESIQKRPHPLYWQSQKEALEVLLHQVVCLDLESLSLSGFVPSAFEVDCRQTLDIHANSEKKGLWPEMKGRIDRLDVHAIDGRIRIVDYKITFRKNALPGEKNLQQSALRGQKLQAPIYQQLASLYAEESSEHQSTQSACTFLYIAPNWKGGPLIFAEFPEDAWTGEAGKALERTFEQIFKSIQQGAFFMKPGEHCQFCDVLSTCRQAHPASRARLENDPRWKALEDLKKNKVPKE